MGETQICEFYHILRSKQSNVIENRGGGNHL